MGKTRNAGKPSLGRTLVKEKRQSGRMIGKDQWLHTSEIQDGYDWGRLNLRSVTEQTAIDDFLTTAELADTEFTAEKANIQIITSRNIPGVFTDEELNSIRELQSQNEKFVRVPRRPSWDSNTSPEELQKTEKESFLDWRRQLALLQESDSKLLLTPYEKNIDIWRQLWRVVERSDIVCQIVDARNPLLYRCEDLDRYVSEVNASKISMLLVNKSDLLTEPQRKHWANYFNKKGIKAVFWSALAESEKENDKSSEDAEHNNEESDVGSLEDDDEQETHEDAGKPEAEAVSELTESVGKRNSDIADTIKLLNIDEKKGERNETLSDRLLEEGDTGDDILPGHCLGSSQGRGTADSSNVQADECKSEKESTEDTINSMDCRTNISDSNVFNTTHLYNREEMVELFKSFKSPGSQDNEQPYITVGLVGYPNVGKSSTINALLQTKKTSVSATPGKTKHFQTLFVDEDLCLCDCPGLVFPHFVSSKAEMILGGVLPIDEMRDCVPPVTLLCRYIPRTVLEVTYGINIPSPPEGDDQTRMPTAYELLSAYASMRGFMTSNGLPDCSRASRYILKDFVKGRLLYCAPPPTVSEADFEPCAAVIASGTKILTKNKHLQPNMATTKKIDSEFFGQRQHTSVSKAPTGIRRPGSTDLQEYAIAGKPWKKHFNKNKKEKLRRLHKQ